MDSYIPSSVLQDRRANIHHAAAPLQPQQQPKISTVTGNLCCPTSHSHHLQHQHQHHLSHSGHSSTQRQKTILIGQEYYARTDEERFEGGLNPEDEAEEREYQEAKRARKLKKERKRQAKELKRQKKKEKKRAKEEAAMATKVAAATFAANSMGVITGAGAAAMKGLYPKTKNVAVAVGLNNNRYNSSKTNSNPTSSSISYQHPGQAVKQWFRSRFSSYNDNRTTATATTRLREGSELGTEQEQSHHRLLPEDEESDEEEEEEEHAIDSGVGQEPERLWPLSPKSTMMERVTASSSSTSVNISSCAHRTLPFESVSAASSTSYNAAGQKDIGTIVDRTRVNSNSQEKGRGLLLDSHSHTTISSPSLSSPSTCCDHNDNNDPQGVVCSSSSCCCCLSSDETQAPTKIIAKSATLTATVALRLPTPGKKGPQFCLRRVWSKIHGSWHPVSNHLQGVSTDININNTNDSHGRVDKHQKKKDL